MMRSLLLAVYVAVASSFHVVAPMRSVQPRVQQVPQMRLKPQSAAAGVALALALAGGNPSLTQAAVEPPAVVRAPPSRAAAAHRL